MIARSIREVVSRARPPALIPVRNEVNQTKGCYFLALDATCLEK